MSDECGSTSVLTPHMAVLSGHMTQCDHEPQGPPLGSRIDPSVHSMFTLFPAVSSRSSLCGSDLNWAPLRNAPESPQLTFPVQLPYGPSVDVSVL